MFLSRGDRDLGVAFQTHPGRQAFISSGSKEPRSALESRRGSARLLAETRRLILGLRPTVLDDMGLVPAIRWYGESHLGDRGIEVAVDAAVPAERLPPHIEVALFRIVQEALANVA